MMLQNKNAIIYGAGGSLGAAVAKALAAEGAQVFLSGHHLASVQKIANEIISAGGKAQAAEVDALNEDAVGIYVDEVVKNSGSLDISFNAVGLRDTQDIPLVEMKVDDFTRPVDIAMRTHFITATTAGRYMIKQGQRCDFVFDSHTRWNWLSQCRWLWACLLRYRKLFEKPGLGTRTVWCAGGEYQVRWVA